MTISCCPDDTRQVPSGNRMALPFALRRQFRLVAIGHLLRALWQARLHRRQRLRQIGIVEHLDDHRRRDIGLPPRGTPVRQIYYQW